jgi:hypothetical protein
MLQQEKSGNPDLDDKKQNLVNENNNNDDRKLANLAERNKIFVSRRCSSNYFCLFCLSFWVAGRVARWFLF